MGTETVQENDMSQDTETKLDILNRLATAAMWMTIPAGIALGLSIQAFNAVFPVWFFPYGCWLQIALYVGLLALVGKRVPQELTQARICSVVMFFAPVLLFMMLPGGDVEWEKIQRFSPFVAWGTPLALMGVVSMPFVRKSRTSP